MRKFLVTACLAVFGLLGACKTVPTANQQTGITLAVELATGAAIEYQITDPGAKKVRAQLFEDGAKAIQKINDAGTLTLPLLAQTLQPLIAKLPPADQLAANTLVLALKPWVDQQLTNPAVANTQATIDVFLNAVIAACAIYTGS